MTTLPFRQQGVSLVVTLVLVILLSLLALYGAGILVLDTRSSANDYRSREALAAAETGIDQAYSMLNINRSRFTNNGLDLNSDGDTSDTNEAAWGDCGSQPQCTAIRSGDRANWQWLEINQALLTLPTNGSFRLFLMTPKTGDSRLFLYYMVAIGKSADDTSTNITKQGAWFYPIITKAPDTPLMSYGEIGGSGTWDVVTNPNGGGPGVPVTAWSNKPVSIAGAGRTCQLGAFLSTDSTYTYVTDSNGNTLQKCDSCSCPASDFLSASGSLGPDIVASDASFPSDPFKWLFGVAYTSYSTIKNDATVLADCSSLNSASNGLIWVTGACSISATVGSYDKPVLLVVENNSFQMTGHEDFFGLVFIFSTTGYNAASTTNVHLAGGATMYGAIMTNAKINLGNGTYKMRYDKTVLENLNNSVTARALSRVTGSWSDVQE